MPMVFSQICYNYDRQLENARRYVEEGCTVYGSFVLDNVFYNVRWGADVDEYRVGIAILVSSSALPGPLTHVEALLCPDSNRILRAAVDAAHGDAEAIRKANDALVERQKRMPEPLRQAILRGYERLEAWQKGGPFPNTPEALFAPREET